MTSTSQEQTKESFSFKWSRRETYESDAMQVNARQWLFERYCEGDPSRVDAWLERGPKLILDAGCGSGFSALLFFGDRLRAHDYLGVDISDAIEVAKERFAEHDIPGDFIKADVSRLDVPNESVDLIFSEGVLHHTDNTGNSIKHLARKVRPGGLFMFYVYAKKAAIRELADDYVRNQLADVDDETAWKLLEPLSDLGRVLGELDVQIEIEKPIEILGIEAGKYDLQRFFYWNFLKAYYRPELSIQEMNHINFDWYRPLNCHRHTSAEVVAFCSQAGLDIEHMDVQPAGITVVSRRR